MNGVNVATLVSSISVLVAVVAVVVTWWLNHKQRALQLRLTLFDKRLAIYRATEEFINSVLKTDGSINLFIDFRKFQDVVEEAKFLFPDDSGVATYLTEVKDKGLKLYPFAKKKEGQTASEQNPEANELIKYFAYDALTKRNLVFAPQLKVPKP